MAHGCKPVDWRSLKFSRNGLGAAGPLIYYFGFICLLDGTSTAPNPTGVNISDTRDTDSTENANRYTRKGGNTSGCRGEGRKRSSES